MNHTYKPVILPRKDRSGRAIFDDSGRRVTRIGMAKQKDVVAYQTDVVRLTRVSKPSGWRPSGSWIRVRYHFFLKRQIDTDNALKALNDALAMAIDVNDKLFLPCVWPPPSISKNEKYPRVEIEIDDLVESPSLSPDSSESSDSSPPSTASSTTSRPTVRFSSDIHGKVSRGSPNQSSPKSPPNLG